jgi:hypothetical protein
MNLEKVYYDSEGDQCNILQMVKREPKWAANRIQAGEDAIDKLTNNYTQPTQEPRQPVEDEPNNETTKDAE